MPESTHYPLAEAATAIRVMSAAEHTGKLILDIPHAGRSSVVLPPEQAQVFRRDGSYIITGGLGGLGLFLAEKMATAGAGASCSPRARNPPKRRWKPSNSSAPSAPTWWWSAATSPRPVPRRSWSPRQPPRALPLRGVLHAAAVVEDATLANITDELIERDWAPKVYGAWHLHEAQNRKPSSRWTGSARSPRRRPWWAHRARAPMPRPTAGWTPSPTGGGPRACRPPRSPGAPGPRSARRDACRRNAATRSARRKAPTRSRRCCATTAPTPATRR